MRAWLRDLWRSRFRMVPKVRHDTLQQTFRLLSISKRRERDTFVSVLLDCDKWLADRRPDAGKSRDRVDALRKRINGVMG